ncbi:MAG: TrkH family potassium uptake protein [Candidatus Aenigmarchaeota archaeon]
MDWKSVFSYLGLVLIILSFLMLLPLAVSFIFAENVYVPFLLGALVSFVIGIFLSKKFEKEPLTLGSAMVLAGLTFVTISLLGSIVYLDHLEPINAVFESVSGFTTTGLTTVNPESLPYSILFWRSLTQWIGGIGILIIFLLLLSSPGMSSYYIYRAEGHSHRIEAGVYSTVKRIFLIYGIYTVIGIVLLTLVGMPLFDSFNHTFTSIATGGFSVKNNSTGAYNSPLIEVVMILLMVLGATSFFIHDKLFKRKFTEYVKNSEVRLFWTIIIVFSALVSLSFLSNPEPFRVGIFQAFSALTGSGFTLTSNYPELSKLLLPILMIIGGFAGSTAGGLKLVRVGILGKAITWVSKKISYPISAVVPFKFHRRIVSDEELSIISLFSFVYILILIISTIALSFMGYAPIDSFFVSASAEGTVGLTTIDIASMNPLGKTMLMIDMLLGRLEILPFFVLLFAVYSGLQKRRR